MRRLPVSILLLMLGGCVQPTPSPSPSSPPPSTTLVSSPSPSPTVPQHAWDCLNPQFPTALVRKEKRVGERYIVAFKDRPGFVRHSANDVGAYARVVGAKEVRAFKTIEGFSAKLDAKTLRRFLTDEAVWVEEEGEVKASGLNLAPSIADGVVGPVGFRMSKSPAKSHTTGAGTAFHGHSRAIGSPDRLEVVRSSGMAVAAEGLALLSTSVMLGSMPSGSHQFQMGNIDTPAMATYVMDVHSARNFSHEKQVGRPVGIHAAPSGNAEAAIAMSSESANPAMAPAWVRSQYILEKPGSWVTSSSAALIPSSSSQPAPDESDRKGHNGMVSRRLSVAQVPWNTDRTDQRDLPLDGVYNPGSTGNGIHIAIVDTGLNLSHLEFQGRVGEGYSSVGFSYDDDQGHGSHVSGIAAGALYGIAKEATLHPVKVLDKTGSGSDSGVIEGLDWVLALKQENPEWPIVVNMSLGGSASPALDQATCRLIFGGVPVVAAAGNDGRNACLDSPGHVWQAITVGASSTSDGVAGFSNYGACVSIHAPGVDVKSAWIGSATATNTISGTSMAAPHVAGVVALTQQRNPLFGTIEIADRLVMLATKDVLDSVHGSPNRLVYSRAN